MPIDWCAPPSGASVRPEGVADQHEAGVLVAGVIADAVSPQAAILTGVGAGAVLLVLLYTRTARVWAAF